MSLDQHSGPEIIDRFGFVTVGGKAKLTQFVELLGMWQRTHNLVASSALNDVWTRHVADSLQLAPYAEGYQNWVDLGSGAGFPGLVVAIALGDQGAGSMTLVESSHKKAAFLRAAARATGVEVTVAADRIERYAPRIAGQADVVSARALAGTAELCRLAYPYLASSGQLLLLKGQDFVQEERLAAKSWSYDLLVSPSVTDPGGQIVQIRNLKPRATP
jgi:16S rRNA (guanine527-N7)-methyltransferase